MRVAKTKRMPNTTCMHIPSNKVADISRYVHLELADKYPQGELDMFVLFLFEAFLGWDQVQYMLHRGDTINQSDLLKFHWAVEDLKRFRPIQHICGYTDFCGLRIQVSPDVLIPRPETEEMVLHVRRLIADSTLRASSLRVLDLCSGSGCIALSLKSFFADAVVCGVDISPKAVEMAQHNARRLELEVQFNQGDVLADIPSLPVSEFDLIVSNPPYVMDSEREVMQSNVLDYEPHLALFVPDRDPLLFYRAIADYAAAHLSRKGFLVLEINEQLASEMLAMLRLKGFEGECYRDFRNKDRYIIAQLS